MIKHNKWVSTHWLEENLHDPQLRIVDSSWFFPHQKRDPQEEFIQKHIPRAVFFDHEKIADPDSPYPRMLPKPEKFSKNMTLLGIDNDNMVIVYDNSGLFAAARAWWMMRVMGIFALAILQGGFTKWSKEKRPVESGNSLPSLSKKPFKANFQSDLFADVDIVKQIMQTDGAIILDAREAERFYGRKPDPYPNLRPGHIPGAINLPYSELLNELGTLKSTDELRTIFEQKGVKEDTKVITTCGSGITAAILCYALEAIGHRQYALYDGSWSEWGSKPDLPVETE